MDETDISTTVHNPPKTLAEKGQKKVNCMASGKSVYNIKTIRRWLCASEVYLSSCELKKF